jgi:hypothetical protein
MVAGEVVQTDQGERLAGPASPLGTGQVAQLGEQLQLDCTVRQGSRVGSWKT